MHHVPGKNRNQRIDRSLEELVEPTSFARIIDAFVDALDLESFGFTYFQLNEEGRPPYHPGVLLKLCLYGYHHGIRPCRKLAESCRLNIEVMWLVEQRQPSYSAINNFRKDNAVAFREVFRRFVFVLREWKLIGGKTIAIDSFKIRAQNSLKNNYNAAKIERHRKYADRNNRRVTQNLDFYRQRQQLIEHQFGTLKRQRGFEHVLLRGKTAVLGEVSLMFLTYNLGRAVSILGFSCLLRRLRAYLQEKSTIFLFLAWRGAGGNGCCFGEVGHQGSCG